MMGGVVVTKEAVRNEAVEGIVPVSGTVRDEKTLGKRGTNQNIIYVRVREEEAYGEGKYPVSCTSGIMRNMDMWVQWLMTVVRGANSTLTYGRPRGDEQGGNWP
jgi:hypothetical protein